MLLDNSKVNRDQLLTIGDLFDFKSQILFEIRTMLKEFTGQSGKKWLKSKEVRKLLNISPGTLQNLRAKKVLPFTRVGGIIFHDEADIQTTAGIEKKWIKVSMIFLD
jgi:hypothetical protein